MARKSKGRQSKGRGVTLPEMQGARLQSPTLQWDSPPSQVALPSVAELVKLDVAGRQKILKRFGVTPSWDYMRSSASSYVTRMTAYPPGSPDWQFEVDKLTSWDSKQGSLRISRAAYKQFNTLDQLKDVDPKTQEFINITEGDEHVCTPCEGRAGEEGTMAYLSSIGLSEDVCFGSCRCDRFLIGDE